MPAPSAFARAAEAHPPGVRLVRSKVDVFLEALATVDPASAEDARRALLDPGWPVNGVSRVLGVVAAELGIDDPPKNKAVEGWRRANG